MLLNPQEAMERHIKEHEELALGKNGKLYVELGLGMTRAIMAAPESMEHGVGYTDLAKIDEQAKVVKQYAAGPTTVSPQRPNILQQQCRGQSDVDACGMGRSALQHAEIHEASGQSVSTPRMQAEISCQRVRKVFGKGATAFEAVTAATFSVEKGEFVCLLGRAVAARAPF